MGDPIRILIADRSAAARTLLRSLLADDERFDVVADVTSCAEALERCADVDLVVLDVVLGDVDGFAALRAIHLLRPEMPVVFFSPVDPVYLRAEAARSGAAGFFSPADDIGRVIDGIAAVPVCRT